MRKVLKWGGYTVGGLIALLLVVAVAMYLIGGSKLNRTYEVPAVALAVSDDSAAVARGAHLAATHGCQDCHGADLSGEVMADAPPFRIVAPNLTTLMDERSDAELERAIRHGVKADGTSLLIMPARAYHGLADEDVAALIAYLRTVPAVENELPPMQMKPLGRILSAGPFDPAFEVNLEPSPATRPAIAPTAEYGAYLYGTLCHYCHGDDGLGMETPPIPESPPAPSLVAAGQWTLDEFRTTLRTGTTPAGRELSPEFMPVSIMQQFDSTETAALHAYFGTLQARAQMASTVE